MIDKLAAVWAALLKLGVCVNMTAVFYYLGATINIAIPMVGVALVWAATLGWLASGSRRIGLSLLLFVVTFFVALGMEGLAA